MQSVEIILQSISESDTEIIVNAANSALKEGGGVCGVIFRAAGYKELQEACDRIGGCKTGEAVLTPGFNLCRYLVHAVGPRYIDGNHDEAKLLHSCYMKSLDLSKEHDCHSIAFPLISSGIYGYPLRPAWIEAARAISDWTKRYPDYEIRIEFAVIDGEFLRLGRQIFAENSLLLVKKEDWKTFEMPQQRDHFEITSSLTQRQTDLLRRGHLPLEMEDKWFRYMEGDLLYVHRSWSGFCIYIADFSEKGKIRVTVNRDQEQYACTDMEEDRKRFSDLLSGWIAESYDPYEEWLRESAEALKTG